MFDMRFVIILFLVVGIFAALFAVTWTQNPLEDMRAALEVDLEGVKSTDPHYGTGSTLDYGRIKQVVNGKPKLWRTLIAAPPPPPKRIVPPNLKDMLKGVVAPRRNQIGKRVRIITTTDKKGSYYGVGDALKGLTIIAIDEDTVEFALTKGGKEYTYKLRRR